MLTEGVGHMRLASDDLRCLLGEVGHHLARDAMRDEFIQGGLVEGQRGGHGAV